METVLRPTINVDEIVDLIDEYQDLVDGDVMPLQQKRIAEFLKASKELLETSLYFYKLTRPLSAQSHYTVHILTLIEEIDSLKL